MTKIGRLSRASVYTAASGAPANRGTTMCEPRIRPPWGAASGSRALAQPVRPGTGRIDNPGAFDPLFLAAEFISQKHPDDSPMADIHGQHLGVIANHRPSFYSLDQPLGNQSLGKLTLRVFVTENRPAPSRVQQALELALILMAGISLQLASAQMAIQPQAGAHGESAAAAFLIEREQKMNRMYQVRVLLATAAVVPPGTREPVRSRACSR